MPEFGHIHNRMPLILEAYAYEHWLSGEDQGYQAKALLFGLQINSEEVVAPAIG